jgi:tripartite-type tricarboxylate transporter receptor subunit TctC
MKLLRRTSLKFAGAAAAAPASSKILSVGTYPPPPIIMIMPFPAGFPVDAVGRVLADPMK